MSEKIQESINDIQTYLCNAKNPFVLFTGDIFSLLILHLVRKHGHRPIQVLFVDTTFYFREIYLFVEKIKRLWGLTITREGPDQNQTYPTSQDERVLCCRQLKADALSRSLSKYEIDLLFLGIDTNFLIEQLENKTNARKLNSIVVNPIKNLSESEVWGYIKELNIPCCSLYGKGYRDIDCEPCTAKPEQGTHILDEESRNKIIVMDKLKRLGYF